VNSALEVSFLSSSSLEANHSSQNILFYIRWKQYVNFIALPALARLTWFAKFASKKQKVSTPTTYVIFDFCNLAAAPASP
jgi:hypothetical protein